MKSDEDAKRYDAGDDDPARCYNCGDYGREVDPGSGEYICLTCGDMWDIYAELPEIP